MTSQSTKRRHDKAQALYEKRRHWPLGTPVTVCRANGGTLVTVTESHVFRHEGGAYVRVSGIPGNTRLDRVTRRGPRGEPMEDA